MVLIKTAKNDTAQRFLLFTLIIKPNLWVTLWEKKTDWATSSCGVNGARARKALISNFTKEEDSAEQISALLPDTDAECPFRELTTKATFRNDTSRCYLRGRAHENRNSQMVSTLVFLWSKCLCITVSWSCVLFQTNPTFRYGLAPSARSSFHADHSVPLWTRVCFPFIVKVS